MKQLAFGISAAFLIIVACGGVNQASAAIKGDSKITATSTGQTIAADGSSHIAGTDSNKSGVRDDIEKYINLSYTDTAQRAAAIQAAKAIQQALTVDTLDGSALKKANSSLAKAVHCVYERFTVKNSKKQASMVAQELESMTTNTEQRVQAYKRFNKAISGSSWPLPNGNSCE